jgi:glycerol-3-phosphate dehydrogenase
VGNVAAYNLIEQRSVIDRIAREEDSGRSLPKADAARGMPGQMQHLEAAIPEIDHVALAHAPRGRRGQPCEAPQVEAGTRQRCDEARTHLIACPLQCGDELHRVIGAQHAEVVRSPGELLGLCRVRDAIAELVQRPHMVEVAVGGDGRQSLIEQFLGRRAQTRNPHAGVDEQIAVPTAHVPDVALLDTDHVGLPDAGDAIGEPLPLEPAIGDVQLHGVCSSGKRQGKLTAAMSREVDLLVVGGGINGAGIARDAAGRGLSVCLIEQADLASFTSSASTKLIHGGLRYLEYRQFRLVREALAERERLLAIAPHLIRPLRFVLPFAPGLRPRWQIRLGLFVYDHVGGRKRLPASRSIDLAREPSGAALKRAFAHGFEYADCRVDDSRLVVVNALDAAARGAAILPHTRLVRAQDDQGTWRAACLDLASGRAFDVRARALVNATGAWVNQVRRCAGMRAPERMRLIQGSHIVVRRLFEGNQAYILQNPDRRVVFAIPFEQHFTLIGTTDTPYGGDLASVHVLPHEIAYLCESINRYFERPISPEDVVWSYCGVRALHDDEATDAAAVTRDYTLDVERAPSGAPLLSVVGGKITTFRRLAEAALSKLQPLIGGSSHSWTARAALPGGDLPAGDLEQFTEDAKRRWPALPAALIARLASSYGTRMELVVGAAAQLAQLGERFGADLTAAEVDYLVKHEWAKTAHDILWRRSKLGLAVDAQAAARLERYLRSGGDQ